MQHTNLIFPKATQHAKATKHAKVSKHDWLSYGFLLITCFCWASGFIIGKISVASLPPITVAALRFGVATIFFLLVLLTLMPKSINWHNLVLAFWPALLGVTLYNIVFFWGLKLGFASHGVILVPGLGPAMTAILGALLLKDYISKRQIMGIMISFAGLMVLLGKNLFEDAGAGSLHADLVFMLCTIFWSLYSLRLKWVLQHHAISPLLLTALATILGTILLMMLAGLRGELSIQLITNIEPNEWIYIIYLGILGTVIPFWLWSVAIKRIGAARSSIFLNFVPLFGVVMALFLLDEPANFTLPLALILILAGVWFTQKPESV